MTITVGSMLKSRNTGEKIKVTGYLPGSHMVQVEGSFLFRSLNHFL